MSLFTLENIAIVLMFLHIILNKRINKSMLEICKYIVIVIITMSICCYIKETSVLISFFFTRHGKTLLKTISKIRIKPSRSMPDFTNIDILVILKATYYSFTSPFKYQIIEMQNRILTIYLEIIKHIKQIIGKNYNNRCYA